jgi:hypothetical protein
MSAATVALIEPEDQPILAPVTQATSWAWVHGLSQNPPHRNADPREVATVATIRRTATIRSGTRMIKPLSGGQLTSCLAGRRPSGFCYRAFDLAGLRAPDDLAMLTGVGFQRPGAVVYALRWRATGPDDYHIPFSVPVGELPSYPGLSAMPTQDRLGPPIVGTGFAPSSHHLIPEFITADFADVALPVASLLVAFTPAGEEIMLYRYLPEQDAWVRMFGPQWRHLVAGVPEISPDQEYVQASRPHVGRVRRYARWRGALCTVIRVDGGWVRLRLCRPDAESGPALGAHCVERGVHEVWVPAAEISENGEDAEPGRS